MCRPGRFSFFFFLFPFFWLPTQQIAHELGKFIDEVGTTSYRKPRTFISFSTSAGLTLLYTQQLVVNTGNPAPPQDKKRLDNSVSGWDMWGRRATKRMDWVVCFPDCRPPTSY
ncbi:hypothetical protein L209DRAFT_490888 [Thermothelomyces heterothallicus CBS 203.75]